MLRFNPFQTATSYHFKDEEGREFKAPDKRSLITQIVNYREQNDLSPIDYLSFAIDDYLCRLPENSGKCGQMEIKRGFFEFWTGGFSLLKQVFYGEKNMVSQEEAERRSKICEHCKYNVYPDKDEFLEYADKLAQAMTGGRRTENYDALANCEVCSCLIRAKVHHKKPFTLREDQKKRMSEVGCWQI